ncbi:MAG: GNAT family N-acetyltransferase, partial [Clostridiales bacterium]|nr:GNAT family N-acetyltransferase [Clostridiales bacterium]
MSDPILYKGRGTPEMYDDLMDFMNYVFGFNGNEKDFKKLLPKLYKPEYDPCHSNYVVTENGKLKAAIGAFDSDLSVDGEILRSRGIGNVAVHPYSRSKGYMKD